MATIEERASDYSHELLYNGKGVSHAIDANKAYIKGAKDQQAIDIDKACEWLDKMLLTYFEAHKEDLAINEYYKGDFISLFKKTMKEQTR